MSINNLSLRGSVRLTDIINPLPRRGISRLFQSIPMGKGYCMGGNTGAWTNVIEDLTFSVETSQSISAVLSVAVGFPVGVNTNKDGYRMGGTADNGSQYYLNTIDNLIFSNETVCTIVATMASTNSAGCGVSSLTNGYYMGGYCVNNVPNTASTVIVRLSFSTESINDISNTLPSSRVYNHCGVGNYTKGYSMGGVYPSTSIAIACNLITSLTYDTEISQNIAATLDTVTSLGAGVNSLDKGYHIGGVNGWPSVTAVIENLIFSNESSQAITATLDTAKYGGCGVNSSDKGYCMGGSISASPFYTSVIEDLIFSNETSQTITATLDTAKRYAGGVQSGSL